MILPMFDYNVFFISIMYTRAEKKDLQKRQNNAIRTCLMYNRKDHITTDRLQNRMRLVSLEQRRNIQLLKLLYVRIINCSYV